MAKPLSFYAVCPLGLETMLADELVAAGGKIYKTERGGVAFDGDMEAAMEAHRLPLWALESQDPVRDFDMIAFTVGYEMSYTNILNMLRLGNIPLYASERRGLEHMVFAGGACMYNPEPLADFFDFFSIGEGEEMTPEILTLYRRAKHEGWTRPVFLREVAKIEGVLGVEELGNRNFRIRFTEAQEVIDQIVKLSAANDWRLSEVRVEKSSLDNIFAELSKKAH